ncbi:MAG: bifunctional precorrin-2 dehydrogenase/sirohydrochlorin ferrochelatase [Oscillibacter sp.]|nr:bifunctional precorrin-2 dehydrogenase/sirohydrochlorin ferrochelatase [Oscillibacter sp.]MBQ9618703.1 bifunctional precorrin-2 dehydrogenase/sirohydrochlorin ferrochelatase [Oscillibacter sp.]
MPDYPFFPLFVDLSRKHIVVFGAGRIAARRIAALTPFTPTLKVVAPEISPELLELERAGKLLIARKAYEYADLDGADFVLAATNRPEVNAQIRADCNRLCIPVNVSSDRGQSDFYFPGVARKGPLVVGVTASGESHTDAARLTAYLRKFMEDWEGDTL